MAERVKNVLKIALNETSVIVLKKLKQGEFSGKSLSESLGLSRTAVWKAVEKLRAAGYEIDAKKGRGYKLKSSPEFSVYEVADLCFNRGIEELYQFKEIDSTNTFLKRLVSERGVKALAIAEKQSVGRGRLNRRWFSDYGGLYFSISLNAVSDIERVPLVTLTSGVAVCKALRKFADVKIKWPNDIMLNDKKLGGILCELSGEAERLWTIIGIGINVKNKVPLDTATSFLEEGIDVGLIDVLKEILKELFIQLEKLNKGLWSEIREDWIKLTNMIGKNVKIISAGKLYEGVAIGIDEKGALIVECEDGVKKIYSGDCFYS